VISRKDKVKLRPSIMKDSNVTSLAWLHIKEFSSRLIYDKNKRTVSPNEAALAIQRRTDSVKTGARIRLATIAVLLVNVLGTLTRTTGANLWQIALIRRLAARCSFLSQLSSLKQFSLVSVWHSISIWNFHIVQVWYHYILKNCLKITKLFWNIVSV